MKKTFFALCAFMLTGMIMAQEGSQETQQNTPIEIGNLDDLLEIIDKGFDLNGNYILTDNITLTDDWVPIGDPTGKDDTQLEKYSFKGTFDGAGHTIKGLNFTISSRKSAYMGLFGRIGTDGVVKNLNVDNSDYTAQTCITATEENNQHYTCNVGTIAGVNHGKILNCTSNVIVHCNAGSIDGGGIAGENKGLIKNCVYYSGGVYHGNYTDMRIGGIVGSNELGGTLQNCYLQAAVQGTDISPLYGQSNGEFNDCAYYLDNGHFLGVKLEGRTLYRNDRCWNTLCLPFDVTNYDDDEQSVFYGATIMELDTEGTYEHPTGIDVVTINDVEVTTLFLNFKELNYEDHERIIYAGKPYIVRWETPYLNDIDEIDFPGATLTNLIENLFDESPYGVNHIDTGEESQESQGVTSTDGNVTFMGTYFSKDIEAQDGDNTVLFLNGDDPTGNYLNYVNAPMSINSLRAYFQLNNGYKGDEPYVENEGGISSINVFDLNFGEGSTGLKKVELNIPNSSYEVYDLSGRRVDGENLQSGIYIKNGKKYLIRK